MVEERPAVASTNDMGPSAPEDGTCFAAVAATVPGTTKSATTNRPPAMSRR